MAAEVGHKEEAKSSVKITAKTHVMPIKKLGRRECQLVTFDLPYLAFYYNQKLLFYRGSDFEAIVGKLKDGLALVLEDFYQLAGRLGKDEEGVFRVEYDDDMDGVEVAEAVAEGIEIADLTVHEGSTTLKELIPYNEVLNLEGLRRPLLALQVINLTFIHNFNQSTLNLYILLLFCLQIFVLRNGGN
jgi:BAHD acyltransferase